MEGNFLKNLRGKRLIKDGDNILIGLSGGPDSMALLYLLLKSQKEIDFKIHIGHVNHGIRGEDALSDEEFVRRKAEELNLPFYLKKADMLAYAREKGISAEEAGREIRYSFFNEILDKMGGGKIALAHNKNDQAETLLMRIMRGTGPDGLKGMDFLSGNIIRPLLDWPRQDIEAYIEENQIESVLDKTNLEAIYTRNKIRLELLPYLEENFNPNIIEGLWRLSRTALMDSSFLDYYAREKYNLLLKKKSKDCIILNGAIFKELDRAIQQRVLRIGIEDLNKSLQGIGEVNIGDLMTLFQADRTGKEIHLPNGLLGRLDYGDLEIRKTVGDQLEDYEYNLSLGLNMFKDLGFSLSLSLVDGEEVEGKEEKHIKYFDYEKIKGPLRLRNRRSGDRFRPLGMTGRKKIKDYFIDKKISRHIRDKIPILMDDEDIIWIVGYDISSLYRFDKNSRKLLKVEYYIFNEEDKHGEGY